MKNTDIEKYKSDANNITNNLWKEYSKIECENIMNDIKECLKDAQLISVNKNNLKDYYVDQEIIKNKKLEKTELLNELNTLKQIYKQKFIYNCPSCNNKLQIIENKLSIYTDIITEYSDMNIHDINSKITVIEKKINKLETYIITEENKFDKYQKIEKDINDIISQYEDEINEETLIDDLENIKVFYNLQKKQEAKLSEIQNILQEENLSTSFKIFLKDNNKLKLDIENLENICGKNNEILSEEELRELIINEEKNKDTIERLIKEKNKKNEELLKNKKDIETLKNNHINKYQDINNEESIQTLIKNNENQINEYENDIKMHTSNLDQIYKYNRYIQDLEKYSDFKNKIIELENKEKEDRKKYNASVLLKEKILEAESIAILNIIETINNHSQVYLDYFFPDNPILVKLQSFKETKKDNKPQINIDIDYKSMETDLTSLSGGELSRVILAFTLALSEIFNSPILLLDESTASLDQESTTIVFDAIKENFKNKFVLIVAHQVVLGIFDKIIKIC